MYVAFSRVRFMGPTI